MRYSVYAFLMVVGFGVCLPQPFVALNAAELWNKKTVTSKETGGKSLYNGSKLHYGGDVALYNRGGVQAVQKRDNGYLSTINAYKVVRKTKPQSSKLWKFMGRNAAISRQSDVDAALQLEYELQIANSKYQIEQARKFEEERQKMDKLHGEQIAAYKANKQKITQKQLDSKIAMLKKSGLFKDNPSALIGKVSAGNAQVSHVKPARLFNESK